MELIDVIKDLTTLIQEQNERGITLAEYPICFDYKFGVAMQELINASKLV